jgi:hypothetical protein
LAAIERRAALNCAAMLAKIFFHEIAHNSDFPARIGPRDIRQFGPTLSQGCILLSSIGPCGEHFSLCACLVA